MALATRSQPSKTTAVATALTPTKIRGAITADQRTPKTGQEKRREHQHHMQVRPDLFRIDHRLLRRHLERAQTPCREARPEVPRTATMSV